MNLDFPAFLRPRNEYKRTFFHFMDGGKAVTRTANLCPGAPEAAVVNLYQFMTIFV